jgi:CRISPR-associated protein Cmr4
MNTRLVLLHALSPIHCGTGQAIGGIDLPIARERSTHVPLVPGSSFKGVLRASFGDHHLTVPIFGPDTDAAAEHAGAVQFGDLHLAFLPVRSLRGTFAYVTSRFLLRRLARDAREAGLAWKVPSEPPNKETVKLASKARLAGNDGKVLFEDFEFGSAEDSDLRALASSVAGLLLPNDEASFFTDRVCLVHDDVMSLLLDTCTEVTARNRIDPEKGTVEKGALWTEEALPGESVLAGLVVETAVRRKNGDTSADLLGALSKHLAERTLQVGGNATVGRGQCRALLAGGK